MTALTTLTGQQAVAGAPITVRATFQARTVGEDTAGGFFLGTTTTSVAPATFAGLTHTDGSNYSDAFWDTVNNVLSNLWAGGVQPAYNDNYVFTRQLRIDANYAVGKRIWFATFASNAPSGSDAPITVAGPYVIA